MSITRDKIKRLEKELKEIEPEKNPLAICERGEKDGLFYYNSNNGEKVYKTTEELIEKEGIKGHLIILD